MSYSVFTFGGKFRVSKSDYYLEYRVFEYSKWITLTLANVHARLPVNYLGA